MHDGGDGGVGESRGAGVGESRGAGVGESRGGGVGEGRGAGVGHRMVKARVRAGDSHQRQQSDEDLREIKVII